jgi:serine/threonine protein kinase
MAWPIPDDYRQALQNAHNNLIPAALKPVSPQMDKLGRPRVQTGAFAAVFEVTDTTGTRWALRCFTRTVPDGQQRYQAIAQAIQAAALPYFVAFHYIEEGVRIAGEAYPLVQMEWLEGESFASYVEHNITNASELQRLARQVHGLVMDLELKGLAHGDLSGDNMRVVGGQLRLIDYDGIYSRHLQGLKPPEEVGTEHFRHPLRPAEPFFGPTMDRFSALLCITSLHALSVEPSLWGRFGATDRLIFK